MQGGTRIENANCKEGPVGSDWDENVFWRRGRCGMIPLFATNERCSTDGSFYIYVITVNGVHDPSWEEQSYASLLLYHNCPQGE